MDLLQTVLVTVCSPFSSDKEQANGTVCLPLFKTASLFYPQMPQSHTQSQKDKTTSQQSPQ
jgi:hypothetical protein